MKIIYSHVAVQRFIAFFHSGIFECVTSDSDSEVQLVMYSLHLSVLHSSDLIRNGIHVFNHACLIMSLGQDVDPVTNTKD